MMLLSTQQPTCWHSRGWAPTTCVHRFRQAGPRPAKASDSNEPPKQPASDIKQNNEFTVAQDAAGFKAPDGEPELWWVRKYEARRKQEAQQQQQANQESQSANSAAQVGPPSSQGPTPVLNTSSTSAAQPAVTPWWSLVAQVGRLVLVLWLLLVFPATLEPGGLYSLRLWGLVVTYLAFFSAVIKRQVQHGNLASGSADKQRASWLNRLRLLMFILAVLVLHWLVVLRSTRLYLTSNTWYEVLALPTLATAVWLHWRAAQDLGQAWDRIVAPPQLVTTGIYAHLQHPIYTSYIMLFCGMAFLLHSAPTALLFLLVSCLHYGHRTKLEAQVLSEAFGQQYQAYHSRTRRFIPLLY